MSDLKQFRMPDVGEGLTEADIITWAVAVGDTVVVNQTLVEVETAKAAVELPSPFAGVVQALHAEAGETVEVGRPIITIDTAVGGSSAAPAEPPAPSAAPAAAASVAPPAAPPAEKRQSVLVGYGPRAGAATRRVRRARPEEAVPTAQAAYATLPDTELRPAPPLSTGPVLAKPPVRKLAKTLGIDLTTIVPTGPNGSISREDLEGASPVPAGAPAGAPAPGRETRIPIRGIRKHTAAAMVSSAFTAPHVTEFVTVDVSAMMELRERIAARREFRELKVSPLLLVSHAVLWAARLTPLINSTWDEAAQEIVQKNYVNLGIAAATDRGLVVPNIKDADRMSLRELAVAIDHLTATARSGKTSPADLAGGTITITNVGVFGIDTGTPILNPGEVAILAVGAVKRAPWVVSDAAGERIEPRWVTQLAVSFDHRVIDGADGSRFLADVAGVLNDPALAVL